MWVFNISKGNFWSISLVHFIKHRKPIIWMHSELSWCLGWLWFRVYPCSTFHPSSLIWAFDIACNQYTFLLEFWLQYDMRQFPSWNFQKYWKDPCHSSSNQLSWAIWRCFGQDILHTSSLWQVLKIDQKQISKY